MILVLLPTLAALPQELQKPDSQASAQQSPDKRNANKAGAGEEHGGPGQGVSQELTEASREAAGEGEENAQFKHSPSVRWLAGITGLSLKSAYWLAIAVNFIIIAAAILWFMKSNLPAMFRTRTQSIQKTMEEARRASQDANRRLSEIENRLARLDAEIAAMRTSAEQEAAAEDERIRAAAEQDGRKIVEAAQNEIEAAARLAKRELKAYAAELAVSLAERRIHVDPTTDRALVQRFTRELTSKNGEREAG